MRSKQAESFMNHIGALGEDLRPAPPLDSVAMGSGEILKSGLGRKECAIGPAVQLSGAYDSRRVSRRAAVQPGQRGRIWTDVEGRSAPTCGTEEWDMTRPGTYRCHGSHGRAVKDSTRWQ